MIVFRTSIFEHAKKLDGKGGISTAGRWHSAGRPIVYTATNAPLAALERIAHLNGKIPSNLFWVRVSIQDDLGEEDLTAASTHDLKNSRRYGDEWLHRCEEPLARVLSVLVPEQNHNLLINPQHPDALRITVESANPWVIDRRFLSAGKKLPPKRKL